MPNNNRAAPSCAPMPDPKFASNSVNPTTVNRGFHARPATHTYAVSTSGNFWDAGQISCATYTSTADNNPITTHVKTVPTEYCAGDFPLLPKESKYRRNRYTSAPR